MDDETLEMTGELADELAAAQVIDPRTIPCRHSLLKQMALSPAHYYYAAQQPQDDSIAARLAAAAPLGTKRSDALRFGTACHAMLFDTGFVDVFRGARRAGKEWESFQRGAAERGAVEILNAKEFDRAVDIVSAIKADETAMSLLFDDTRVEQRIDWSWDGRAFRSTPDAVKPGKHLVDLKTAITAHPDRFPRAARSLYYHCQAALYLEALESIGEPVPDDECYVIAVEKSKPNPVVVWRLSPAAIEEGRKINRLWFERLRACEEANSWPSYAVRVLELDWSEDFAEDSVTRAAS